MKKYVVPITLIIVITLILLPIAVWAQSDPEQPNPEQLSTPLFDIPPPAIGEETIHVVTITMTEHQEKCDSADSIVEFMKSPTITCVRDQGSTGGLYMETTWMVYRSYAKYLGKVVWHLFIAGVYYEAWEFPYVREEPGPNEDQVILIWSGYMQARAGYDHYIYAAEVIHVTAGGKIPVDNELPIRIIPTIMGYGVCPPHIKVLPEKFYLPWLGHNA